MNTQNKHHLFEDEHVDDYSVLNFLLEHVKGLSPSSLTPQFVFYDENEVE